MPSTTIAESTAILVLGMHRSGTSVTTRVVNLLGADLGSHFLPPADDNPTGFWEHLGAYEIHERLLAALGRKWHDVTEMPAGWLDHPAAIRAQQELEELIRVEFSGSSLWAVKDPRMCRLVPLWLRAMANLGIRATALIVLREPREVAQSLKVRDGWSHGYSYLMWAQHFLEAEAATRDIPRSVVSYETLMYDWRSSFDKVAVDLGITWPHSADEVESQIAAYVDPMSHRHHSASGLKRNSEVPPPPLLVDGSYRHGCQIEAGAAAWESLQPFESQYNVGRDMFALAISDQTAMLSKSVSDILVWRSEAETCGARVKEMSAEGEQLQTALDNALATIGQLTDRVGHLESIGAALQAQLNDLHAALAQSENEKLALQGRFDALEKDDADVRLKLEILQAATRSRKWLLARLLGFH